MEQPATSNRIATDLSGSASSGPDCRGSDPGVAVPRETDRNPSATVDAINLMLRDLHTRHDEIRHRAAFRGCTKELLALQQELVDYLLARKQGLCGGTKHKPNDGLNYNSFT